jgi:trimethylamine--corrinoid protein Co-methyltransferase
MFDPASGSRHPMTQEDLAYATRLADAMDQIDLYSVIGTPHDAPAETNDRTQLAISLLNTTKHIWNTAYGREGVGDAVRMASAVRGGREALRRYPLFTLDLTTLSPLQLDGRQAGTMVAGAREGLPIGISPGPIAGATGPVTLAGTLTQANAELLGAITLVQTTNPGTPVIFTQYTRNLDMATGSVTMGGPEFSLLRVATAEMAAYYNLPSRGGGLIADAKAVDAQMGAEKMLNCVLASLSGLTVLAGAGLVDFINTFRPDQLLVDNEIISSTRRLLEGIRIDGEAIAAEVIAQVGPGGNYLAHDHTAANFRRELWFPRLWDRRPWSVWEEQGEKDVARRAADRLASLDHRPPPLPANVEAEIWGIVREAESRVA